MLSKWQCRQLQVKILISERAIPGIQAIKFISSIRRILNLIFESTLRSELTRTTSSGLLIYIFMFIYFIIIKSRTQLFQSPNITLRLGVP